MPAVISATDIVRKFASGEPLLLINVLPAEYFKAAHIPGSRSVPLSAGFAEAVETLAGGKAFPIALYSANSNCGEALKAEEILEKAGFSTVSRLDGGLEGWIRQSGPVSSPSSSTASCCGGACGCGG